MNHECYFCGKQMPAITDENADAVCDAWVPEFWSVANGTDIQHGPSCCECAAKYLRVGGVSGELELA